MKSSTGRRRCTQCGLLRAESSFTSARGRKCAVCRKTNRRSGGRAQRVQSTYGLTPEDYELLWTEQEGKCGCGRPLVRKPRAVDVDHDHFLEQQGYPIRQTVRGLLHPGCNRKVLVYARNDPERLRNLAAYLDDPPGRRVL